MGTLMNADKRYWEGKAEVTKSPITMAKQRLSVKPLRELSFYYAHSRFLNRNS